MVVIKKHFVFLNFHDFQCLQNLKIKINHEKCKKSDNNNYKNENQCNDDRKISKGLVREREREEEMRMKEGVVDSSGTFTAIRQEDQDMIFGQNKADRRLHIIACW